MLEKRFEIGAQIVSLHTSYIEYRLIPTTKVIPYRQITFLRKDSSFGNDELVIMGLPQCGISITAYDEDRLLLSEIFRFVIDKIS